MLSIALLAGVAAYFYYAGQPERYSATTAIFIQPSEVSRAVGQSSSGSDAARTRRNEATLLLSTPVARVVAEQIGFEGDPRALLGSVSASSVEDSDFLLVSAVAAAPEPAAVLANAFAQAYIRVRGADFRAEVNEAIRSLRDQLEALPDNQGNRGRAGALRARIQRLQVLASVPPSSARQFEPARAALAAPIGQSPLRYAVFALIVGLVLGIAAAYALEALGVRIRWSGDIEGLYDQPVLAQVPHARHTTAAVAGRVAIPEQLVEPMRTLRTNLQLGELAPDGGDASHLSTLAVVSAVGGEGKSTITGNLGLAYVESGARVLLIDADFRNPSLSRAFAERGALGLADALSGKASAEEAIRPLEAHARGPEAVRSPGADSTGAGESDSGDAVGASVEAGSISLLPAGRVAGDPAALLGLPTMPGVLARLSHEYDVVLLDTSPLLPVSDGLPLLPLVDGVLITTRVGVTSRSAARQLVTRIDRVPGANVVGVVANDVRASEGLQYYYPSGSRQRGLRNPLARG